MHSNRVIVGLGAAALGAALVSVTIGDALLLRPIRFPLGEQSIRRPNDSSSFFGDRNTINVTVPYNMTVNDLIALYKLEPTRPQILAALDTRDGRTPLAAGRLISVTLTPPLPPMRREVSR